MRFRDIISTCVGKEVKAKPPDTCFLRLLPCPSLRLLVCFTALSGATFGLRLELTSDSLPLGLPNYVGQKVKTQERGGGITPDSTLILHGH